MPVSWERPLKVRPPVLDTVGENIRRLHYRIEGTLRAQERLKGKLAVPGLRRSEKVSLLSRLAEAETLHGVLKGRQGVLSRRLEGRAGSGSLPAAGDAELARKLAEVAGPNAHLVFRAKRGDEEAMETLLKAYEGHVQQIAKQFFIDGTEEEKEDFRQEGRIAIVAAARAFNPDLIALRRKEQGAPTKPDEFGSFASMKIRNKIVALVRKGTVESRRPGREAVSIDDEENIAVALRLKSSLGRSEQDALSNIGVERIMRLAKENLSELEMVAFEALVASGGTINKIKISPRLLEKAEEAAGKPLSPKAWENAVFRAKQKLKKALEKP